MSEDWSQLVFADECRFKLRSDGRVCLWRRPGERDEIMGNHNFWGAFSYKEVLPLLNAPERCNSDHYIQLIQTTGIQNLPSLGPKFDDDNGPIDRSKVVGDWEQENVIAAVPWSAHSPD